VQPEDVGLAALLRIQGAFEAALLAADPALHIAVLVGVVLALAVAVAVAVVAVVVVVVVVVVDVAEIPVVVAAVVLWLATSFEAMFPSTRRAWNEHDGGSGCAHYFLSLSSQRLGPGLPCFAVLFFSPALHQWLPGLP